MISLDNPRDSAEQVVSDLLRVPAPADELGRIFADHGHTLHLVGGSVRDALLGRAGDPSDTNATGGTGGGAPDLDFTTDARPERVLEITRGWAEATWDAGIAFGTVGLARRGVRFEVTTYRSESYDRTSRNPAVTYGEGLQEDLVRRDFTVNAMAVSVPGHDFVDLFGGMADLARGVLRTPGPPEASFDDDPLRILRAARFEAALGLTPVPELVAAMRSRASRISIVSPERVRDELRKLIASRDPVAGLERLVEVGVADLVLPELGAMRMEIDEHHQHKDVYAHTMTVLRQAMALEDDGPDEILRWAALLHDIGKPRTRRHIAGGGVSFHHHEVVGRDMTRRRLVALRFPKDVVDAISSLVYLHLRFHGYGSGEWTDAAVRRYVHDAGPQLSRLHKLVRSDCTTRNRRKAENLARAYRSLEERIADLAAHEEIAAIRPELSGDDIMALLGLPPSRLVGQARAYMLDVRFERGLLGREAAEAELFRWARENDIVIPGETPTPDEAPDA
ncbi:MULTISPECIES: CCA tRNA nucleotidyltransferase [unclassified Parafrankia]|uniref:CCA tRNA nucleotidyltransferase n=1 Tax=unclassified Parafrankia TaxID=2994368 RepID=UPI000DA484AB|nr:MULTISPECIES: CCA tRNA nucleotidyltransferase [unclassified Parafrankia]TCJ35394.1 CCA tRNA nucleotidyltransferase [Parafrankia sp. BMG5.11]SQD98672.1 Polynucleotide adenylyltransferase/metal dependent phosphohydrolase [Parafrankia sp. Ea1.12]